MSPNARKHIRRKPKTLTPGELLVRAGKWARGLRSEPDRGCALVTAEMFSELLESVIANRFVDDPCICKRMLSDGMAPLGSFAARINIALLLGLIAKEVHAVLHSIREIRNAFAHEPTRITFGSKPISDVCHGLPNGFDPGPMPRRGVTKKARAARMRFMSAASYCMSAIMTERWNVTRLTPSIPAASFGETINPELHVPIQSDEGIKTAKNRRIRRRRGR